MSYEPMTLVFFSDYLFNRGKARDGMIEIY